ncbi:terminase large subunit domain-containing protein [Alistipes muris]|uniref:terminase large subunit domain-containing protein n=1 Tax=Alistipes muris TaxID=2941326 RepID=UPI002040D19C|nr:terminase family protein [Alistipes muris]
MQPFHRAYYRVLEAFARGQVRRLIVTMPPQHGKSVGATTLLPAYILGADPDCRVAIASYSGALASKFNRRVQRILESREYGDIFPVTTIKCGNKPPNYIRTADEVEIVGHRGGLLSVGREGSLTGNRVDCFVLDDLYKDALEANSPIIRANCWEWYTSVVRTRMHNASRELIVFTRWHEEDLIGTIMQREKVVALRRWEQLGTLRHDEWLHLNFEALKVSPSSELDPRRPGVRPRGAAARARCAGRVVPPARQQGGPHPLQRGDRAASAALPARLAAAVARAPRPSDRLQAPVPGQPLARRARRAYGNRRA